MPLEPEEIEAAALALSREQRADLAHTLLESLEGDGEVPDFAALERSWVELADCRYQEYLDGDAQAIPADVVLARLSARARRV